MATFYCNGVGQSPAYSVSLEYGTVTRSGNTVTIPNIKLKMTSISVSGNNWQTANRLAYRCGIGGSQINIADNETIHNNDGSYANTSYTINIGTRTVTVSGTATSFPFYCAVASTGYNTGWTNFQGNSPCVVFDGNISCPAGTPTWTTQPTASATSETQIVVSLGATDMTSTKTIFYKKSTASNYSSTTDTTLSGLSVNTSYNIYVQASANGFDVNSNTITVSTYSYPSLSSISPSSGNIGTGVTLNITNPLNREVKVKMQYALTSGGTYTNYNEGGSSIKYWTSTGTSITVVPDKSALYNLIPNQTSLYVKFTLIYNNVNRGTSSVFIYNMVAADCAPSWTGVSASDITYYDGNSVITGITGNNQQIVQSKSNIYIKLKKAATAQYGATINNYTCWITGNSTSQTLTVNTAKPMGVSSSGSTITVTIVATDSRGLEVPITKNITNVISYTNPTGVVSVKRINNWENQTTLTIVPNWAINNNNVGIISYKYKKSTDSSWSSTYNYNSVTTLNLDNQYSWDFSITLTDSLNGTTILTAAVDKGSPICFIDPTKLSVGINRFPETNNILDVAGDARILYGLAPVWKMTFPTTNAQTYYKVASGTMNTAENLNLTFFVQHGGSPHWLGICAMNLRSDGTTVSINSCKWLTKIGIASTKFRVCVSGKVWTLYLSKNAGDSGTYYITELSRRNENGNLPTDAIVYTTAVEASSDNPPTGSTANLDSSLNMSDFYPVGSVYITTSQTSPASLFGGTWAHINSRFLYSASSESASTTSTGGSSTRTLSASNIPQHTHSIPALTGTAESAGGHSHVVTRATTSYATGSQSSWRCLSWAGTSHDYSDVVSSESAGAHTHTVTTDASTTGSYGGNSSGNTASFSILPPYFVVHIWRRTA